MNLSEFETKCNEIVDQTVKLKNKYITETLGAIDYISIFPKSKKDHLLLVKLITRLDSKKVFADDKGEVYYVEKSLRIEGNRISLLKICNYDPDETRIGYLDFQTDNYDVLKNKYLGKQNFISLKGEGWELFGVEDTNSEVSFYIPNIPLSKDLGFV